MMLRLHDNPPILWPRVESLAELPGRWWVAHTRSRAEKAFAWDLVRLNVGYFLPMVLRTRVSGRRKRTALLPLFRGYVFFCGTEENRYQAMRTDRLCRTISAADQRHLIAELCHLHRGLQGKADLDPYPHAAIGRRCRVGIRRGGRREEQTHAAGAPGGDSGTRGGHGNRLRPGRTGGLIAA